MAVRDRGLAELGPGRAGLLLALFSALAMLHTWPLITDPAHLSRLDNNDTAFNTWVIAWVAHTLPRDPLSLFQAPIFHPEPNALAYSEHMTVPAIMGMPLFWLGASPVLVYNLLVLVGNTLSAFAMCWLLIRWTGSTAAGIVAGALFGFNAHMLTRFAHLQAQHVEFIPIAFYALDRLLEDPRAKYAALLAAAFVLQALCANYTMVLLTFALGAAVGVRPELWGPRARAVWQWLAIATVGAVAIIAPFLWPYYRVRNDLGLVRTIDDVRMYSAGWQDYLATAGRLHFQWWSHRFFANRTALFPGITAVGLSIVAVGARAAWRDRRARMALAFGIVGVALSFGASLPGYEWLHNHVPLMQGMRAAARWGFLGLTAVAILAGFGVATLQSWWGTRSWWPACVIAILGLVTIEALRAPLSLVRFDGIKSVHRRLATPEVTGIVVFPLYGGGEFHQNARYMLDQTRHWRPMINAYSSFAPQSFFDRVARLQKFPAPETIAELKSIGVSHVVLFKPPLEKNFGREAVASLRTHPDFEFVIDQDDFAIYRIR